MFQMRNEFSRGKRIKIVLVTDGLKYSKLVINEITNKPFFSQNRSVYCSVYERILLKNTLKQMGVSHK